MKRDELDALLRDVLQRHHLELDDLSVQRAGKRRMVRVTVDGDGPQGTGPDLDQMAEASRDISELLDAENAMGDTPYTLEVTSRGVNAPLTKIEHYRRNRGRLVQLTMEDTSLTGRIVEAHDDTVTVDVDDDQQRILLSDIDKAVVQVEMNRRPHEEK